MADFFDTGIQKHIAGVFLFFFFCRFACDDIVVPCCINSAIDTRFLSQKMAAISFLVDSVCLKLFGE
jgi:hypothetical protein